MHDEADELLNGDDTVTARFRCQVPDTAVADFDDPASPVTPARAALYGHGLFGEGPGGEFRAGNVRAMQTEHNIMFCATDWIGMAQEDFVTGVIHRILADVSRLPRQLDRSQQGILNAMFLAELLRHPDGSLLLMELELIEPYLYPEQGSRLGERMAKAVAARVKGR